MFFEIVKMILMCSVAILLSINYLMAFILFFQEICLVRSEDRTPLWAYIGGFVTVFLHHSNHRIR